MFTGKRWGKGWDFTEVQEKVRDSQGKYSDLLDDCQMIRIWLVIFEWLKLLVFMLVFHGRFSGRLSKMSY